MLVPSAREHDTENSFHRHPDLPLSPAQKLKLETLERQLVGMIEIGEIWLLAAFLLRTSSHMRLLAAAPARQELSS